jgi:predicted RNase H-like HicB family nuclease
MIKVKHKNFKGTVVIQKEDPWYVATCLENNIASQGKTIDEAIENLKEALELFFEEEQEIPEYQPVYITTLELAV